MFQKVDAYAGDPILTLMERFKEELFAGLMQSMQSPESQLNELIKETVYKNHPYGVPNKTYLESLKNITADDLKKFVKKYMK